MSNYIVKQSKKFQKLVTDNLVMSSNLQIINYLPTNKPKKDFILSYKNSVVISTSKLNELYNTNFTSDFSIIFIMYKNLKYKDNFTYLSHDEKKTIIQILNDIPYKFDVDDIYVIGRKYTDKSSGDTNNNSLSKLCNVYGLYKEKVERNTKPKIETEDFSKNYRRLLRENLLKLLPSDSKVYMNDLYKNSIFLDTEYVTDIIDDFSEFPLSKNLAMNFMIGLGTVKKHDIEYTNLIIDKIDHLLEYSILEKYLVFLENFSKDKDYILLVHWSQADKTSLNKGINKYPDLLTRLKKINYIYVDLMDVCKRTFFSNSYSLKYIAKNIMNYDYQSDCQNGFDAMISYIDSTLNENITVTNDLIKYNKIDTEILYKLIKYIIS
jgi:hypothetical protein